MARPRTPTKKLKIAGTYRKDRRPENEPEPVKPDQCPKPPVYLDKVAKEEWKRIAGELYEIGLLNNLNYFSVIGYCRSFSKYVGLLQISEEIEGKAGILSAHMQTSPKGHKQTAALEDTIKRAATEMRAFAKQIPLSPVDMAGVNIKKKKPKSKMEEYGKKFEVVK